MKQLKIIRHIVSDCVIINNVIIIAVKNGVVIFYPDCTRRFISNNWYNDINVNNL